MLTPAGMSKTSATWKVLGGVGAVLVGRSLLRRHRKLDLRGKVVVVTGGSRGLGLVLARELVARGASVAIGARDAAELERARMDLSIRGGTVHAGVLDVTDRDSVGRFIAEVQDEVGAIDILINNAGVIQVGPLARIALEDFDRAIATHMYGPLYATMAVLPSMRSRRAGRIVNIASIGGKVAVPHLAPYSASKFGLVGMSTAMRQELIADGIYVTTVCPGLMRTGSQRHAQLRGNHEAEYAWFGVSASLPGTSMNAERAAHQIIEAMVHGDAELTLSIPARAAALLAGLAPNLVAEIGGVIARLMPSAAHTDRTMKEGKDAENPLAPSLLTRLGDLAAARNNEV